MASGFTKHGGKTVSSQDRSDGRKGVNTEESNNLPPSMGHPALTRQSAIKHSHLQPLSSCGESNTSLPEIRIPDETSPTGRLVSGHRKVQYTRSCEDMTGSQSSEPRVRQSSQGDTRLSSDPDGRLTGEPDHTILFQTASRLLRSQDTEPDAQTSRRQPHIQKGHRSSSVPGKLITSPTDRPQIFFRKKSKKLVLRLPSGELLEGKVLFLHCCQRSC